MEEVGASVAGAKETGGEQGIKRGREVAEAGGEGPRHEEVPVAGTRMNVRPGVLMCRIFPFIRQGCTRSLGAGG